PRHLDHLTDDDALGKIAVEPGGEHPIADRDVGVAVEVVHVAGPVGAALDDAAGAAALHDRVDAAVVIGEQDDAGGAVARLGDLPDDALRCDHGHAAADLVALAAVDRQGHR